MRPSRLKGQRWRRRNNFGVPCNAAKKRKRKGRWPRLYQRPRSYDQMPP